MSRTATAIQLLLILVMPTLPAQDLWLQPFGGHNNARQLVPGVVERVSQGFAWETGNQNLPVQSTIAMDATHAYALAFNDLGTTASADDTVTVRQFDLATGAAGWESPPLSVGFSISFGTASAPTLAPDENALYIATGTDMQKLSLADGSIVWNTTIGPDNTTSASTIGAYQFLNGGVTLGGDLVFVESYDLSFAGNDKQTIAFDRTTGDVRWFNYDRGQGTGVPLYIDDGSTSRVITATAGGVACYRAADGQPLWTNLDAPTTWSTFNYLFAPLVHDDGRVFALANSFGATAELFCIDALDGSLLWVVPDAPSSSNPPVVVGSQVYLLGGPFGAAEFAAYLVTNGAIQNRRMIGGGNFATFIAATTNRLYHADASALKVLRLISGELIDSIPGDYSGGIALTPEGDLVVHYGVAGGLGGLRRFNDSRVTATDHAVFLYE